MSKRKASVERTWPAERIEHWKLDDLRPFERNSRKHTDDQIAKIAVAIKEWGWTTPILATEEGVIVAGHARAMAARKLGIDEVPVIVARGWSDEQVRAYVIADNALGDMSEFDEDVLRLEIGDLSALDFDVGALGFTDADLARLLAAKEDIGDASTEWKGMPEFKQEDKTAFRSIPVHFKDQEAVDAFAKLIGQKITDKTRFVWFPEIEIETYADKRYTAE